jgi:hypothetical protein
VRYAILSCLILFMSTAWYPDLTAAQPNRADPPDNKILDVSDIIKHQQEWRAKILPVLAASTEFGATPKEQADYQKISKEFAASAQKMYPVGTPVRVTGYVMAVRDFEKDSVTGKQSFSIQLNSSTKAKPDPGDSGVSCRTSDDALVSKLVLGQQITLEGRFGTIQAQPIGVESNKKGFNIQRTRCVESKGR